ncbi:MAG: LysM peptidoglycan-binding domain-containing protein [Candidatus Methylomirabilales bacterium]
MQWRWPNVLSALLVLIAATSLEAQEPRASPPAGSEATLPVEALHQVQPTDNLHLLAAYYYGDARQWARIFETNRDAIKNPNLIHPGQIFRILLPPGWTPREPYTHWKRRLRGAVKLP